MKKLLTLLLVAVAALSTAFAFTACDLFGGTDSDTDNNSTVEGNEENGGSAGNSGNTDNSGNSESSGNNSGTSHTHSYVWKVTDPTETTEGKSIGTCSCGDIQTMTFPVLTDSRYIKTDDTATCSEKGQIKYSIVLDNKTYFFTIETPATGEHDFVNGVCSVCKAVDPDYVPHTHTYVDKSDESGHWTECDCGDKTALVPHSYSYAHDDDYHWQVCSVKGETTEKVAHNFVDGVCVCGASDPDYVPHTHTYIDKSNANGHWTECDCGDKTALVPHSYSYAHDDDYHWQVCSVKGETTEKVVHNYVDGVCVCGAVKPAEELDYKLNDNGKEYSVVGIGTVTSKQVVIPATYHNLPVTEIGYAAFEDCDITEITVPYSIKSIDFSFYNCNNLSRVNYTGTVSGWASISMWISSFGHIMYNAHSLYIDGKHVTDVVVDNIENFGCGFMYSDIVSVKIGSNVETLSGFAFSYCSELVSAEIADGVEIGLMGSTFRGCVKLANVKLPSNIKVISQAMFEQCVSLKSIDLPNGLTHIDNGAFRYSGLTSINIPSSVLRVGAFAFEYCNDLQAITFADNSGWQFNGCVEIALSNPIEMFELYQFNCYFGFSETENLLVALTDPIQAYTSHLIFAAIMLRGDNGDITHCEVEYKNGNIWLSVDGEEYYLSLSVSLLKDDTVDINGCGWITGNYVSSNFTIIA